jgi:hypothetical protein
MAQFSYNWPDYLCDFVQPGCLTPTRNKTLSSGIECATKD